MRSGAAASWRKKDTALSPQKRVLLSRECVEEGHAARGDPWLNAGFDLRETLTRLHAALETGQLSEQAVDLGVIDDKASEVTRRDTGQPTTERLGLEQRRGEELPWRGVGRQAGERVDGHGSPRSAISRDADAGDALGSRHMVQPRMPRGQWISGVSARESRLQSGMRTARHPQA